MSSVGIGRSPKTILSIAGILCFLMLFSMLAWQANASIGDQVSSCVGMFQEMCGHCLLGLGVGHSR